jgi:hypothetical protein
MKKITKNERVYNISFGIFLKEAKTKKVAIFENSDEETEK